MTVVARNPAAAAAARPITRAAGVARVAVCATFGLLVGGCSGSLLTSDDPPAATYQLRFADEAPHAGAASSAQSEASPLVLLVARPRAASPLDTDRIAIAPGSNRFEYYSGARWSQTAPQMLQRALVDSLTADGRFAAVLAAPARVPAELMLDVELRRFEAVATDSESAPVVHVQILANLVDSRRALRVVSFLSEATAPARENRMGAVVDAFEAASAKVVADVVQHLREAQVPVTLPAAVPATSR